MISTAAARTNNALSLYHTAALILVGDICFYLAYTFKPCSFLILVYLYASASLARQASNRRAFYFGLVAGVCAYAPQLSFFYAIFGPAAISLWFVLAVWIGLFALLARLCLMYFGAAWTIALLPFIIESRDQILSAR